jgi:hypothetical protein
MGGGLVFVRNGMSDGIKKKIFAVINLVCKRGKATLKYYVRFDAYVTKLAGFGTGIKQHIYGECTDGRVVFNFIYRCRNNTFLSYCDAEVFGRCRMRAISIMSFVLFERKTCEMNRHKIFPFLFHDSIIM